MKTFLTVGECQEVYNKYNLGISEHTKETTLLCQIIKQIESSPVEPVVLQKIAEVIDKEIKKLRGTSTHGTCCTCQECKNNYDDCTCTEIKTLKNIKEKLASNFSA